MKEKKIFNQNNRSIKPKPLRDVRVTLRFTQTEKEELNARAEAAGCGHNLSKFIRICVKDSNVDCPMPLPKINHQTYVELSRIGNNLNQIARAINISLKSGNLNVADCTGEIEALNRVMKDIKKSLIGMPQENDL
ncbi:MAG: plasmid mobilization relaxosome protein MobC [Cyanobacteria bacterium P01_D01_bin.116]